ncbi:MAG: endonuclease/exonuclease/phosphatase family protein [Cyanobacteria bacterium P01_F01_bin.53]
MKNGIKHLSAVAAISCTVLALGITAVAILSHHLGGIFLFAVLSPFQMQYFVALLTLSAIALCLKRPRLILLTLFCAALLSAQIAPWYVPSLQSTASTSYRVLSANLNITNQRATKVLAWTEKEQPDLALFLEVNNVMAEKLEALKTVMPYSSNQAYPYQPGAVLYSKYPLTDAKIQKFNTNNAVNLTAQVQVKNKGKEQPISIVAIHPLPPMNRTFLKKRNTVFSAVGEYVKQQIDPVLLIGDFNVTMWSPHYRSLVHQTNLKNTRKGFGTLPTWPVNLSRYFTPTLGFLERFIQIPIDQCLVSPSLSVTGMHTGDNLGSDHLPIVIDLSLG